MTLLTLEHDEPATFQVVDFDNPPPPRLAVFASGPGEPMRKLGAYNFEDPQAQAYDLAQRRR
jgi:hypothetical protein